MSDRRLIIVGRKPVAETLEREAIRMERIYVYRRARGLDDLRRAARVAGVPILDVPLGRLRKIAGTTRHQGVVAYRGPLAFEPLEDVIAKAAPNLDAVKRKKPLLIVLAHVEDPHNVGAILRSAVAAGVRGAIVPTKRMAPISAAVIKASAGTAARIPISRVKNLPETLYQLKEHGYWVIGAAGDKGMSVWQTDWNRPIALVVGNEGRGLGDSVADGCDELVTIPMPGDAESLNVSVAAGILLFAAVRDQ